MHRIRRDLQCASLGAGHKVPECAFSEIAQDRLDYAARAAAVHTVVEDQAIQRTELLEGIFDLPGDGFIEKRGKEDIADTRTVRRWHELRNNWKRSGNTITHEHDIARFFIRRLNCEHHSAAFGAAHALAVCFSVFNHWEAVHGQDAVMLFQAALVSR